MQSTMRRFSKLFALSTLIFFEPISSFELENRKVSARFDSFSGLLQSVFDKTSNTEMMGDASVSTSVLNFELVGKSGPIAIDKLGNVVGRIESDSNLKKVLTLEWNNVELFSESTLVGNAEMTTTISLDDESTIFEWDYSFTVKNGSSAVGIWDISFSFPTSISSDDNGQLLYPGGFGYLYENPIKSTKGFHSKLYPCGECTMQFMALGNKRLPVGAYLAAMDPNGQPKSIQFSSKTGQASVASSKNRPWRRNLDQSVPKQLKWHHAAQETATAMTIVVYPENAGVPLTEGVAYTAPYKMAMGVVPLVSPSEGRPLWTEAAQIYRDWALSSAAWTQSGPISDPRRQSQFPTWYTETNVWVNSHWQCHDIFDPLGGDPKVVLENTLAVADRLGEEALSLHWYEWQQGPDPSSDARSAQGTKDIV